MSFATSIACACYYNKINAKLNGPYILNSQTDAGERSSRPNHILDADRPIKEQPLQQVDSAKRQSQASQMLPVRTESTIPLVFLCHSKGDKERIRELYNRLQDDGIRCWFDEEDLLPGQDWDYEINKAIRGSRYVVACLSKASINKAGYIQKELRKALDVADEQPEGVAFLIPVRLEECEIPERLRRWQWVDLFKERGYERLLRVLTGTTTASTATISGIPALRASYPGAVLRAIERVWQKELGQAATLQPGNSRYFEHGDSVPHFILTLNSRHDVAVEVLEVSNSARIAQEAMDLRLAALSELTGPVLFIIGPLAPPERVLRHFDTRLNQECSRAWWVVWRSEKQDDEVLRRTLDRIKAVLT